MVRLSAYKFYKDTTEHLTRMLKFDTTFQILIHEKEKNDRLKREI